MVNLDWLVSVPIAHRGLHNSSQGIIENSPSAIKASIDQAFSIEVDIQETVEHNAVVFHDFTLERLTPETGTVRTLDQKTLQSIKLLHTSDTILSLDNLLEEVAGKVGLCIEVKSNFRTDLSDFIAGICQRLLNYSGPVAVKSFDPEVLALIRKFAPELPRGIVACDTKDLSIWGRSTLMERFILRHLLHTPRTRPSFISYCVDDLPMIAPLILKKIFKLPLITWTVSTKLQQEIAQKWADQIVFEGFIPSNYSK